MDEILPVWAQPHSFWALEGGMRKVFTFGLVLPELRSLSDPAAVRSLGRRYGFEWLPGLSAGVQQETHTPLPESALQAFLREEHGILGPNHMSLEGYAANKPAGEPPPEAIDAFAASHGALIRGWALNASNLLDIVVYDLARRRQRLPVGYEHAAASRLRLTQLPHALSAVDSIEGRRRWARTYTSLYQRAALELEDLALRRPRLRSCPLCGRPFVPLRQGQTVCGNQLWDAHSRTLVERCTPTDDTVVYTAAAAADYQRRRKTRWAAMNRTRSRHGHNDPRTRAAIEAWETWKTTNPPPRPPGRPPTSQVETTPPYTPPPD